jgi:hypothetical protein
MRVLIDGKLELNLPAPPRQGEIVSWDGDARRVAEVVWAIPATNMYGQAPSAEDVAVHIQLERDWREGKTDAELHAAFSHPDFEYATTEGARKQFDASVPPADDNGDPDNTWGPNVDAGRNGWERFDHTEEAYWRRRKQQP